MQRRASAGVSPAVRRVSRLRESLYVMAMSSKRQDPATNVTLQMNSERNSAPNPFWESTVDTTTYGPVPAPVISTSPSSSSGLRNTAVAGALSRDFTKLLQALKASSFRSGSVDGALTLTGSSGGLSLCAVTAANPPMTKASMTSGQSDRRMFGAGTATCSSFRRHFPSASCHHPRKDGSVPTASRSRPRAALPKETPLPQTLPLMAVCGQWA
jgi:hypothetical protein